MFVLNEAVAGSRVSALAGRVFKLARAAQVAGFVWLCVEWWQ